MARLGKAAPGRGRKDAGQQRAHRVAEATPCSLIVPSLCTAGAAVSELMGRLHGTPFYCAPDTPRVTREYLE
ncbi:hypothetical protein GCM10022403_084700 [Streptomyces coacervatus]|uniref:Uncharacterized protein n=1 Tax=Streptomyces coacervatus TaxID=647381 RepID=A0ABP7JAE0_9ACTN